MDINIEKEFAPKFEGIDLDFKEQYEKALARVKHYPSNDVIQQAIKNILSEVLQEYSKTHATTKVGRMLRWLSNLGSKLLITLNIKK
jgi:hypothetical protein